MSRKSSDLGSETFSLGINPTCFFCSSAGQMVVLTIGQRADYLVGRSADLKVVQPVVCLVESKVLRTVVLSGRFSTRLATGLTSWLSSWLASWLNRRLLRRLRCVLG
jgi:hypothetical protein